MKSCELKNLIKNGGLKKYEALYRSIDEQSKRFLAAIESFEEIFGKDRDVEIFSVPGRSEICGNHTDHNHGKVLAGAINRDIIAVAAKNDLGVIRLQSEGYGMSEIHLDKVSNSKNFKRFTSTALIAGVCNGFVKNGYAIGGYDAYTTTEVLKGSGISSSAAFEVMIGNILNYTYNEGKVSNEEIAKISQYSENEYFGKPCGLMDQMACAVGGFVYIDFEKPSDPVILPIDFSLTSNGYSLCIVNTGGNHANLNDDYASVPAEMLAMAREMGAENLRGVTREKLIASIPAVRKKLGDRAVLRSLHFFAENERVEKAKDALIEGKIDKLLPIILESGRSSFQYLQNVYTNINVAEQGLSMALCLTEGYLKDRECAFRVHGGGFAGTIQVFLPTEYLEEYSKFMDGIFGNGAAMPLNVRSSGACKLF